MSGITNYSKTINHLNPDLITSNSPICDFIDQNTYLIIFCVVSLFFFSFKLNKNLVSEENKKIDLLPNDLNPNKHIENGYTAFEDLDVDYFMFLNPIFNKIPIFDNDVTLDTIFYTQNTLNALRYVFIHNQENVSNLLFINDSAEIKTFLIFLWDCDSFESFKSYKLDYELIKIILHFIGVRIEYY